jgi:predicted glycosyltransferase
LIITIASPPKISDGELHPRRAITRISIAMPARQLFATTFPRPTHRRVIFYSHDTYGLGHIRRTLCLVRAFLEEEPEADVLLATGSPVIERLPIPQGVQVLSLKPVVKTGADRYEARDGSMNRRAVIAHRSAQLLGAVRFFRPDALVVDHAPLGMKGELAAALEFLRRQVPWVRVVLGLRDILDEPEVVRRTWREQGVYEALDRYYDRILVYGEQRHFALDREYALPPSVRRKLEFTGYIRKRERLLHPALARAELGIAPGATLLLATVGGGGDGFELLLSTAAAIPLLRRQRPDLQAILVTGPLMGEDQQRAITAAVERLPDVRLFAFVPHLTSLIGTSDVVVTMAGYNTVTEILALGRRGVLVPRTAPRREQWIRARLLSRHGLVHMLGPERATPQRLAETVARSLASHARRPSADLVAFEGAEHAVAAIRSLLASDEAQSFKTAGKSR